MLFHYLDSSGFNITLTLRGLGSPLAHKNTEDDTHIAQYGNTIRLFSDDDVNFKCKDTVISVVN
jgi:hypothetical protein